MLSDFTKRENVMSNRLFLDRHDRSRALIPKRQARVSQQSGPLAKPVHLLASSSVIW